MNRVYYINLNKLNKTFPYEELYNKASSYRKEKVDSLKFYKDKCLSLSVDYIFRCALKDIGIDYNSIVIQLDDNNKPFIKNANNLFFNLSHSNKIGMCIISDKEVGCDVEKISDDFLDIAKTYFNKNEINLIEQQKTYKNKQELFFRLWTLKESYTKALGIGLNLDLNKFQISFNKENIEVSSSTNNDTEFYFEEIDLENKNYKCAICSKLFEKSEIKEIKL